MTQPTGTPPTPTCPRCGEALGGAAAAGMLACPRCALVVPAAALAELAWLTAWGGWAAARAEWLRDRLAADALPADGWSVGALPGGTGPAGTPNAAPDAGPFAVRPRPPGTATPVRAAGGPSGGTLLLAGGAVLLVLAGIAFITFAWDRLGPAGQLVTLYALGAAVLAVGVRLRDRLPGTGTTLGVVGTLLVSVSAIATRALGADLVGAGGALLLALVAGGLLAATGVWLLPRDRPVGEVAALAGAGLLLGLGALAPLDDAVEVGDRWAWWPAVVLLLAGVALLLLAPQWEVRSWPPLAAAVLAIGSMVLAGWVADTVASRAGGEDAAGPVAAFVLLALAALLWLLPAILPGRPGQPRWAAAANWVTAAAVALTVGLSLPAGRGLAALALLVAAGCPWAVRRSLPLPLELVDAGAAATLGAAVGLAVAPWADHWVAWSGPAAGLALGALLLALSEIEHRAGAAQGRAAGARSGLAALAATGAGLATWLQALAASVGDEPAVPDDVRRGVAVALALVAVAGWLAAVRRRLPTWSVWPAAALLGGTALLLLDVASVPPQWQPEAVGGCLGAVAGVAGALTWWLRRPAGTPSLVVAGPALTLALAPTTLAVIEDAVDRWWWGADPGTADQVRVVAVLVVGAVLVVVGAWQRLAGVLLPAALALLAVTVVQLVDLGRFLPQWVSFAVAGTLLVVAGARWEAVRRLGRAGGAWLRRLD